MSGAPLAFRVGSLDDGFVGTALVGAYAACGCVGDARKVFDGMAVRDVVSWGIMLDRRCNLGTFKKVEYNLCIIHDSDIYLTNGLAMAFSIPPRIPLSPRSELKPRAEARPYANGRPLHSRRLWHSRPRTRGSMRR